MSILGDRSSSFLLLLDTARSKVLYLNGGKDDRLTERVIIRVRVCINWECDLAGGNWQVIDEKLDINIVKQQNSLSCGAACGEMLLKARGINDIPQAIIIQASGAPVSPAYLAGILNQLSSNSLGEWRGGWLKIEGAEMTELLECLISTGTWAAEFKEIENRFAHLIIVDGFDKDDKILIRDPWQGTSYKMEQIEFFRYWALRGIFWINQ